MTKGGKQVPQADFSGLGSLGDRFSINAPAEPERPEGYRVVPAAEVSANPRNPREELGDLAELQAILETEGQLQACVAVTREAYLGTYLEDAHAIGDAKYVIIAGSRRLAAIQASTVLNDVTIEINDELTNDPQKLQRAALSENINRKNFKPLEEARAIANFIESMDGVKGAQRQAATLLGRTPAWVNQRLALLKLVPEAQAMVEAEELPVKVARRIGTKPEVEQLAALAAWRDREIEQPARQPQSPDSGTGEADPASVESGGGVSVSRPAEPVSVAQAPVPQQSEPTGSVETDTAPSEPEPTGRALVSVSPEASMQQIAAELRERLDENQRHQLAELLLAADHQVTAPV